jgi:hypothetical protein
VIHTVVNSSPAVRKTPKETQQKVRWNPVKHPKVWNHRMDKRTTRWSYARPDKTPIRVQTARTSKKRRTRKVCRECGMPNRPKGTLKCPPPTGHETIDRPQYKISPKQNRAETSPCALEDPKSPEEHATSKRPTTGGEGLQDEEGNEL